MTPATQRLQAFTTQEKQILWENFENLNPALKLDLIDDLLDQSDNTTDENFENISEDLINEGSEESMNPEEVEVQVFIPNMDVVDDENEVNIVDNVVENNVVENNMFENIVENLVVAPLKENFVIQVVREEFEELLVAIEEELNQ